MEEQREENMAEQSSGPDVTEVQEITGGGEILQDSSEQNEAMSAGPQDALNHTEVLEKPAEIETGKENGMQSMGYTGEYGNHIHGEYTKPEQSTYRFSYKNGDGSSTHSGDYYSSKEEKRDASNDYIKAGEIKESRNHAYTGAGDFSGQQGNPYFANDFSQETGPAEKRHDRRKRGQSSFGKKMLVTVACAAVFGVVASTCFIGVNRIYQKNYVTEEKAGTETIQKTTETGNDSTMKQNEIASGNVSVQGGTTDVSAIVEQTMPAIVAITSTTKGTDYYDLFGQYYSGKDTTSAGTGFIVGQNDNELLIATNNHVISGAKTISVQCIDGEIYEAAEKGSDQANDLAVVAVKKKNVKKSTMDAIRVADLGNSEEAKVGEMVVAIGNALGYGQSVTVGYISAKDREITEESEDGSAGNKIKALQTDAAINPGNSGGALINMQGQVIGINSAKIASSSVEGVGYAIPISVATPIIDDMMKREVLEDNEKGYLGISGTTVSEAAAVYNIPTGVYIKAVSKGGAAEKAGIQKSDIITAINNMQVTTMESLKEKVNSYRVGTKVEVTFQRSTDGVYKEQKVTVTLQDQTSIKDLPDDSEQSGQNNGDANNGNNGYGGNGSDGSYNGNDNRNNSGWDDIFDFFQ